MLLKHVFATLILIVGIPSVGGAADPFPADTDFVRKAEQAGTQAMADARGAMSMSKNPALRELAKQIAEDGTEVSQRLATLCVEKGWPAPPLVPVDTTGEYSDRRFLAREIEAQQDALAFYREEAANGADTDLQEFARATVPTLRKRLVSLKSLHTS